MRNVLIAGALILGVTQVQLANQAGTGADIATSGGFNSVRVFVTNSSGIGGAGLTDTQLRASPVPVSGTVTVTDGAGALNVIVDSLPAVSISQTGTANDVDAVCTATNLDIRDLTSVSDSVQVTDGAGALNVIVDSLPNVTVGTFPDNEPINAAQWGGSAVVTGGASGSVGVGGLAAHAASVSGNPEQMGAYAEADAAALDSSGVAEGEITRLKADLEGRLLVNLGHPNRFLATAINSSATSLTQIQAAPGASLSLYITSVTFSASVASTTTTDQYPVLKYGTGANCGTGTTVVWAAFTSANGGVTSTFSDPIKLPANNALCWMHAVAGNKHVVVQGYTAP